MSADGDRRLLELEERLDAQSADLRAERDERTAAVGELTAPLPANPSVERHTRSAEEASFGVHRPKIGPFRARSGRGRLESVSDPRPSLAPAPRDTVWPETNLERGPRNSWPEGVARVATAAGAIATDFGPRIRPGLPLIWPAWGRARSN